MAGLPYVVSISSGRRVPWLLLTCSDLSPLSFFGCVCARASEAHLVVGLLVQRDRRVIKGVLDWLPVKTKALPGEETVQLWHKHTHSLTPSGCSRGFRYCLTHSLSESYSVHSQTDVQMWYLLFPYWSTQLIASYKAMKNGQLLLLMIYFGPVALFFVSPSTTS